MHFFKKSPTNRRVNGFRMMILRKLRDQLLSNLLPSLTDLVFMWMRNYPAMSITYKIARKIAFGIDILKGSRPSV